MNETGHRPWDEWLKPENWPNPNWYTEKKVTSKINHEAYFGHQLRTRYVEQEGEFRTVIGNWGAKDVPTAAKIFDFLQSSRIALEQEKPDLLTISSTLDMVERYMVWEYPPHIINVRVATILTRLESLRPAGWIRNHDKLTELSKDETYESGDLLAMLDESIGACNKQIIENQISNGLQIERLKALRNGGIILLVLFMIGSPIATNLSILKDWPSQLITQGVLKASWLNALGIILMGAAGGFLSGLLQARSSRVSLTEYQENMLKLQIKPLIGALFSLVLYVLLSWQILPGISIQNIGSYFFIAFLSGFSERYFLRLLELKTGKEEPSKASEEISPKKEIAKHATNID